MKPFLSTMKNHLALCYKFHSHSACVLDCGGLDAALDGGCLSNGQCDFPMSNPVRKRCRTPLATALQDLAAMGRFIMKVSAGRVRGNSHPFTFNQA